MLEFLRKVDNIILNCISVRLRNKTFDKIMPIITSIGNLGVVWIIISILLLLRKNDYIAFSRIYLGVHYPSDVLVGGIIGTICGFITFILFF